MGGVMKMTWPEVTDIKNPIYKNRRYLCPYCTLQVSKSLDLWCVFDRLSNFEKCNLRSGHLMWPGAVTFKVRRSKYSGNVSKCSRKTYVNFGVATCRRFFRYPRKKTERGIGVGTMGAVGAAAPTIFNQWVQTMYSASTIIWNKNIFPDHSWNTKGWHLP